MDPGKGLTRPSPVGIPPFADRADVEAAIAGFGRDGFGGPLNYYRAIQPYFDEAGAFAGSLVRQPSFFAFGTEDGMVRLRAPRRENLVRTATDLRGFLPIEGVGHWSHLEASDVVNRTLVGFLQGAGELAGLREDPGQRPTRRDDAAAGGPLTGAPGESV